ncbi:MAG: hypothetical protein Tsb002_06070 [Wenzhouxiangellaceae bacterium]
MMKSTMMPYLALCALPLLWTNPAQAEEPAPDSVAAMQAMMEKSQKYTQPGSRHEQLKHFLGEWKTETRITMAGAPDKGEPGTSTFSWLMEGRWLKEDASGQFMGQPIHSFSIMGYDNFKQSFVATSVSSFDTAMRRAEGDMDPGGKALLMYGTIDEYLTGEHDKMVKVVWRFIGDDEMVMELHDLPIGENNTQVVEIRYTRK